MLQPFSLSKPVVLTVDASRTCVGAVMTQEDHPVLFISRKLTPAESNYSNIEREALAVVWACNRLKNFLLGKSFKIQTDHKPLLYILAPNQNVKIDVSPRLIKYSLNMMHFDYKIHHINGKSNKVADVLSRPILNIDQIEDQVKIPSISFNEPCIDINKLKNKTDCDKFLNKLKSRITSGNWTNSSERECQFKKVAWQLSIDNNGLVRVGSKVVPPQSLYYSIFRVAHQTHNGVKSTLAIMQKEFYWPNMYDSVMAMVKACRECRNRSFCGQKTRDTWSKEDGPWQRLHLDWAFHKVTGNILIIADSYSGWLEALSCSNRTTSTVIDSIRPIFARFGIPLTVVTDNAPEFAGREYRKWLSQIGCSLLHTPEYHPQSNGTAERMVGVVKSYLKCYNSSKASISSYMHRMLFVHRNTALRSGKTPSEIMLGYKARCPIISQFYPMQEVLYKAHAQCQPQPVKFLLKQGQNTSLVANENNRTVLAHDNQIAALGPSETESSRPRRERRATIRYPDIDPRVDGIS